MSKVFPIFLYPIIAPRFHLKQTGLSSVLMLKYNHQPELKTVHVVYMRCFCSLEVPPPHCTHWHQIKIKKEVASHLSLTSIVKQVKKKDVFFSRSSCTVQRLAVCMVCRCISVCVCVAVGDRWVQGTSRHSVPESSVLPWSCPLVSMVIFSLRFFSLLTH